MDIVTDEDKEVVWENFTKQKDGKEIPPFEYGIITRDGRRIETIITTKLIKYEGEPAILGIVTDITERKLEEELIKEKEEQLWLTINSLPDAIHVVDKNLNITMVNDRFKRWNRELGLNGEPEGKSIFDTFSFLESKVREEYEEVMKRRESLETFEKTKVQYRTIYTQTIKIPIIEKDDVSGVITVIRDITKLKKDEMEIRESAERFRVLTEQNIMGMMILQDGRVKYASSAVAEMSELPIDEIVNLTQEEIFNFIRPDDVDFVKDQAHKKQSGIVDGIVTDYKCHITLRSGKEKVLRLYSKTIQYEGRPADFILLNDITKYD